MGRDETLDFSDVFLGMFHLHLLWFTFSTLLLGMETSPAFDIHKEIQKKA